MGKAKRRPQATASTPARDVPQPTVIAPRAQTSAVVVSWQPWLCAAVLVVVTTTAYLPAFSSGFIRWDDPEYVTENVLLHDGAGLAEIWRPFSSKVPQYYPLVFSSFWLEYRAWKLAPAGYHATNVALHLINALLVLQLVRALGATLWVAAGAAAVFALHPVQVESVAWVTERKNTLSAFFYLVSFLLYLRHRRTVSWGAYGGSVLGFACALLSKTQTATLPVLLLFTDWLLQRAGRLRRLALADVTTRLAPMFALALLTAWITARVELQTRVAWQDATHGVLNLPTLDQRIVVALNAPWFYVATLLAPFRLAPIFPKWVLSAADPKWWIGGLASMIVLALLTRWRRRIATAPVWGIVQFLLALVPALGLLPFTYQHNSYVAARFLYLPCIGAGVVLAALLDWLAGSSEWSARRASVAAAGLLLLGGCAVLTYRESMHWQSNLSFWTYAFQRNPDNYAVNTNLGLQYENQQQWLEAARHYQRAHEKLLVDPSAYKSYLDALGKARGPQAVIEACVQELKENRPNPHVAYLFRAQSYEQLGRREEAIADYDHALGIARSGSDTWERARRGRDRLAPATGS